MKDIQQILYEHFDSIAECREEVLKSDEPQWLKELRLFGLKLIEKRKATEIVLKEYSDNKSLKAQLEAIIEIENEYAETFDRAVKA